MSIGWKIAFVSCAEIALICVSLLAGLRFGIRAQSWKLLKRQVILLPILAIYIVYLSVWFVPRPSVGLMVYYVTLCAVVHVSVAMALIDRNAIVWALVGRGERPPELGNIGRRDVILMVAIGIGVVLACTGTYVLAEAEIGGEWGQPLND